MCATSSIIWAKSWQNLLLPYANNKGAAQPAHPRSLISAFVFVTWAQGYNASLNIRSTLSKDGSLVYQKGRLEITVIKTISCIV